MDNKVKVIMKLIILLFFSVNQIIGQVTNTFSQLNLLLSQNESNNFMISFGYDLVGNRITKAISFDGVLVNAKVFLQGAYDESGSLMVDELRDLDYIPELEPYTSLGYIHVGGGEEELHPLVLISSGENAIVDWMVIEIRDKDDPTIVLATQSVLLQRDGDLVSKDGVGIIQFPFVDPDDYYIAVHHRNHVGVMTADPVTLTGDETSSFVDFSNPLSETYGTNGQKEISGVMVMWGGNAKADDNYVRATPRLFPLPPIASDITYILDEILIGDPSSTYDGYHTGDVNMDGFVRMTPLVFPPPGIPSDATFILDEVLDGNPNATKEQQFD